MTKSRRIRRYRIDPRNRAILSEIGDLVRQAEKAPPAGPTISYEEFMARRTRTIDGKPITN